MIVCIQVEVLCIMRKAVAGSDRDNLHPSAIIE